MAARSISMPRAPPAPSEALGWILFGTVLSVSLLATLSRDYAEPMRGSRSARVASTKRSGAVARPTVRWACDSGRRSSRRHLRRCRGLGQHCAAQPPRAPCQLLFSGDITVMVRRCRWCRLTDTGYAPDSYVVEADASLFYLDARRLFLTASATSWACDRSVSLVPERPCPGWSCQFSKLPGAVSAGLVTSACGIVVLGSRACSSGVRR